MTGGVEGTRTIGRKPKAMLLHAAAGNAIAELEVQDDIAAETR